VLENDLHPLRLSICLESWHSRWSCGLTILRYFRPVPNAQCSANYPHNHTRMSRSTETRRSYYIGLRHRFLVPNNTSTQPAGYMLDCSPIAERKQWLETLAQTYRLSTKRGSHSASKHTYNSICLKAHNCVVQAFVPDLTIHRGHHCNR
jgi:hypothetical protein